MRRSVLPPICFLLVPAIDAALTLSLGSLLLPALESSLVGFSAYALSFFVAALADRFAMQLLQKRLFPDVSAEAASRAWWHGWKRDAGPIRTIDRCLRMSLAVTAVGCAFLMNGEGFPSIRQNGLPLVALGAAFIAVLDFILLAIGWHQACQELDL